MKYTCDCGHTFEYTEADVKSHRLMAGDSTKIEDVEKLMDGKKADMVFTDPPYRYKEFGEGGVFNHGKKLKEDLEGLTDFNPDKLLSILGVISGDKINAYIFCNTDLVPDYCLWARDKNFNFNILTWHKKQFVPVSQNHHFPDTEYLIYLSKSAIFNTGLDINYGKYFVMDNEKNKDHPTIKPIELISTEIKISSNKDGIVLDLFLGSGSTLIACEQTNRICYGCEIDPKYCDVIRKRYAKFIGKEEEWQEATPRI
jgi:DNA modification methylase